MPKIVGPEKIMAGDKEYGFYGEVPVEELFSGKEIVDLLFGPTSYKYNRMFSEEPWLKFNSNGKIIYKSKKPYLNDVMYEELQKSRVVHGNRNIVDRYGNRYAVRLMSGVIQDRSVAVVGSEWNKLILPIHENASTGNWSSPELVDKDTPNNWGVNYTNDDLYLPAGYGAKGTNQLCMEYSTNGNPVTRGGNHKIEYISNTHPSYTDEYSGWSPVLELIKEDVVFLSNESGEKKYVIHNNCIYTFSDINKVPMCDQPILLNEKITKYIDVDNDETQEIDCTIKEFFLEKHDGTFKVNKMVNDDEISTNNIVTVVRHTDHLTDLLKSEDVEIYVYNKHETEVEVNLRTKIEATLLLANSDISLKAVDNIDFFKVESTEIGEAEVKMIVSVNEGKTWNTYDNGWSKIEPNVETVNAFGIPKEIFNNIQPDEWNTLRRKSDKIRFGYLISYNNVSDKSYISALNAQFDMTGTWKSAVHGRDFEYEYPNNSTILVKILKNGDYKINY